MLVDSFSSGLDDIPLKEINDRNIIRVLAKTGRFSCFEAGANDKIARAMTRLMKGNLVEVYLPDCLKGKIGIDGTIAPDSNGYPWVYVRVTPSGLKLAGLPPHPGREEI